MRHVLLLVLVTLTTAIAFGQEAPKTLLDARKGHVTKLTSTERDAEPLEEPPAELSSIVKFKSPLGEMSAYLGTAPEEGKKHPAIIWITGGFPPGGIGSSAWERDTVSTSANDQSAKAYRRAGLVMMIPTVRGSFGNPGKQETFYGEVDDILAAADYLAKVDYVDPERIYLGGHSTGGTLALLVAAATDRFKAVFSFGPAESPALYGPGVLTYDPENEQENRLRSPIHFLGAIKSPTFVIEGVGGNLDSLRKLEQACQNNRVRFLAVRDNDHFEVLGPSNQVIAGKIAKLEAANELMLAAAELETACAKAEATRREFTDLRTLASIRASGDDLESVRTVEHYVIARLRTLLDRAVSDAKGAGFRVRETKEYEDSDGDPYYVMFLTREVKLEDLDAVFKISAAASRVAKKHDLQYDGWYLE